ncbi:MAG: SDR family oxidoreductase [Acidimicrobiia bacterium]|nr:SDR family oxidoreductase [Acidimicrobiia bacterium]
MTARILVTGGAGFIGQQVVARLAAEPTVGLLVSADVRAHDAPGGAEAIVLDVRDHALADLLTSRSVNRVIHLASIVTPLPHHTREFLHSVDVEGTLNVIEASLAAGVEHITVTSSGAAYGYHADNPAWIDETDPLRGNPEFAYSDHKRIVEEILAGYRSSHPGLRQLVFRPGTILGASVDNQITAMFGWPVILGIAGSETPFVFIWDTDVVEIITTGCLSGREGIYNLAGDGAVPLRQIASELDKRFLPVPAAVVKAGLAVLGAMKVTPYGPEQVDFLRYRPVLSNRRLIDEFGYTPARTSLEAFRHWRDARG